MARKTRGKQNGKTRVAVRESAQSAASSSQLVDLWIAVALAVATLAVYAQVVGHQFINLDDDLYIRDNPVIARGLTPQGIRWAFTTFHAANWHPVTWLSHMLDVQLFGLRAGGHLLVNMLVHVANTLLLFWLLRRLTGARWASAMIAALFALHPLHVESVAWAAERKDTLAALFGLLALLAYTRYVAAISWKRYGLVAWWLALGLMSKPMLVTWPFVMLLLDYWPLRRIEWRAGESAGSFARKWLPLVREKLLLVALVVASMIVTFIAQSRGGAVRMLTEASPSLRVSNAIVSYAKYLVSTFFPRGLAIYYPFAYTGIPLWQMVAALVLLVGVTAFAVREARTRPYFIVGWLWFIGTLVPVIGLVQVGGQAMADRYHYLPSIGLFVALVFGAAELAQRWQIGRAPIAAIAALVLVACGTLTARQVTRWQDSVTLFTHTLNVTRDNLLVEYNLGHALGQRGESDAAIKHFAEALRLDPQFFDALINMGMTLAGQGRVTEAIGYFERALRVAPQSGKAHAQLALAYVRQEKTSAAVGEFRKAIELDPLDADTRTNLGLMLARQGNVTEALEQLNEAVKLNPNSPEAHNNLGIVLLAGGKARESIPHFSAAMRLKPELAVAQENLRRAEATIRIHGGGQ